MKKHLITLFSLLLVSGLSLADNISIGDRIVINKKHSLKISNRTGVPNIIFSHGWVLESTVTDKSHCIFHPSKNAFLKQFGDPSSYDFIQLNPQIFTVIEIITNENEHNSILMVSKQGGEFILSCFKTDGKDLKNSVDDNVISSSLGQLGQVIKNGSRTSLNGVISNSFGLRSLNL